LALGCLVLAWAGLRLPADWRTVEGNFPAERIAAIYLSPVFLGRPGRDYWRGVYNGAPPPADFTLAETYAEQLEQNPGRRKLDRRGNSLTSAGDIDMLLTVMDCANAIGFFPELILKHLIPRERLTLSYLRRMIYHSNYSLYQLMLSRRIQFRPRRWPLAYITGVLLCFTQGCWHPYTLWLSCFAAQGRYAAYRDYKNGLAETAAAGRTVPGTATAPPLAESAPAKTTGGKNME
jgi:hypothetical protein